MPSIRHLLATLLACILPFALAACVSTPPPASPASAAVRTPLVLVSIDGFRADYLDAGLAPNLSAIAGEGVRAQWMNPSYPSLTFPNHYSIVTGLRPDYHGIVHNTMRDAELGGFRLSNREAVGNGRWWGGEPIWITAQKAGMRSATMFWPGSEAAIGGVRPSPWRPFDKGVTGDRRSVVEGRRVSVRVDPGGARVMKKKDIKKQ